jgi:hypothetical protein
MNNEITNYIDNYKNKAFKTGSYFPNNEKFIKNGFHSETIINEIVKKFGLSYEFTKQLVHEYLLKK